MDNDDKNFTLHNCERALKKKRTDKWWFLKMHLKRERERMKKVHREWSWIDTLKNKQLSVGHGYLKVEAKMDPIIIHNSFEISISPSSSTADLPRSRPTNDSSSNCMTGERGGGPPFFAPATIKTRRRPRSLIIRATLVFHASKVQIPRHVSRVAWKRASGQMPLPPPRVSFFFFSLLSARPNSSRRKKEKKKKKRND